MNYYYCNILILVINPNSMSLLLLSLKARPPGIYKQKYLDKLYSLYGRGKRAPRAPQKPNWKEIGQLSNAQTAIIYAKFFLSDLRY